MDNKPMKLLLIEDDVNECNKFRSLLKIRNDIEFVGITDSDIEGLELVKKFMPEGIILDLELNKGKGNGTGFNFLVELKKIKLPFIPKIIVTTNVCSDTVYDFAHDNGADLILYKKQANYSIDNVINTLLILRNFKTKPSEFVTIEDDKNIENKIMDKINVELDLIGVALHLQGRKYLFDAILYVINESEDSSLSIIQHLVSKYKKSSSTISRAMQNAILHAWRVSSLEDLTTHYTAKVNYETGVPTPTEFIYYYADKIKKII